ncbi:MAG: hypothetical protein V4525_02725 [Pseudomonadota bacterium]
MQCPFCKTENSASAYRCNLCDAVLPAEQPIRPDTIGNSSDQKALYRACVGSENAEHYLEIFEKFDALGKTGPNWNTGAMLVTLYWLVYRKMYSNAAWYTIIPLTLFIITNIISLFIPILNFLVFWVALLNWGLCIIGPLYGDELYYKACKKKIREAQHISPDDISQQCRLLSAQGGVNKKAVIIVAIMVILLSIALIIFSFVFLLPYAEKMGKISPQMVRFFLNN